ncbi:MAG TPA: ABC transporter permease [Gemmatimonadaceae bacterium]|nr:ABC transporter permease [Gemmatimonadaceae bacterium]
MSRLLGFLHSARSILRRHTANLETADEIAFHLERQTQKHLRAGLTLEEARALAVREFGGTTRFRQETADVRHGRFVESLWRDARYGVRSLQRHAGFTVVALLTLAIGIGGTTAAWTIVDRLLLRPLPYPGADRLVALKESSEEDPQGFPFSLPNLVDVRSQTSSFVSIGAFNAFYSPLLDIGTETIRAEGGSVTGTYFATLGIGARLGRLIGPGDAHSGAAPVIVLSNGIWQRRLRADRTVLGRTIRLMGTSYTVIGVAAPEFNYPDGAGFWTACTWCDKPPEEMRKSIGAAVVARLAAGVTLAQASADLRHAVAVIHREHPDAAENQMTSALALPLKDDMVGDSRQRVLMLGGVVAFVLLIGCANLASANLARNLVRQPELALRTALGAGHGRIVQQLLVESLVLAAAGGALGLALATLAVRATAHYGSAILPRLNELRPNWHAAPFTGGVSMVVAVLIGLIPALRLSAADLRLSLGGRGQVGAGSLRLRQLLVGLEMSLSVVLLVSAGLAIRSLQLVLREPMGIDARGIITMQPQLVWRRYASSRAAVGFYDELLEQLLHTAGIAGAAVASAPPLGARWTGFVEIEGQEGKNSATGSAPSAGYNLVSEAFFSTVRVPLLRGRVFTSADDSTHPHVTVVNEAMAKMYWPNADPIGKRFRALSMDSHTRDWLTVIGVVGDVHYYSLETGISPMHYVSIRQRPERALGGTVLVRSVLPAAVAVPAIRRALRAVDPTAVAEVNTIESRVVETTNSRRLTVNLLAVFGAIALVLASIGIYGVLSYIVTQRTREIGVRMALGASVGGVVASVVRDLMTAVLAGLVVGLVAVRLLATLLSSLVYKLDPMDPAVLGATCALLLALALVAAAIPARRAAGIDPAIALRSD